MNAKQRRFHRRHTCPKCGAPCASEPMPEVADPPTRAFDCAACGVVYASPDGT